MPVRGYLLLLCSLLTHLFSAAQFTVKGKAADTLNQQGITWATIQLEPGETGTAVQHLLADSAGAFELPSLTIGRYRLHVSATGYQITTREITLNSQSPAVTNLGLILLTPVSRQLDHVTINSKKPVVDYRDGKLVLQVSGNRFFASSANGMDVLKRIPGLSVGGDGSLLWNGRIPPTVFINGKPVPMSTEELQQYLSGLVPDQISSIEVIHNPGAQYDGEHKAIIDIRLKTPNTRGWRGMVSTQAQQNAYTYAEHLFSLSYTTSKLDYTARLGYAHGNKIYRYQALQHLSNANIMQTRTQTNTGHNNLQLQLGMGYRLNSRHRAELQLRRYVVDRDIRSFNTLYTTDSLLKQVVSHTYTNNRSAPVQHNHAVNLNYTAQLGNHQLQVLTSLLNVRNRQQEDIQTRDAFTDGLQDYWKTVLQNDLHIRTAQADFTGKLGKGKLNAGVKLAFTTTQNNIRYDTLTTGVIFVPDSSRSNRFRYQEAITAAYAGYQGSLHKLNYTLSLRAEHTRSDAYSPAQNERTIRHYTMWLPSVNLTYPLNEHEQLNLSYSHRITRPNFVQLNPFRFYNSPLNYVVGNPYLQPSVTRSLVASYSRRSFITTLTLGREQNPMSRYPEYDTVTHMLAYLGRNLPYNHFASLETSLPLTVNKWWRMTNTLGLYYKKEQTPYHGVTYAIPITQLTFTGSQVFSLPKGFILDVYYNYYSPGGDGLYIANVFYTADLGLQKTWMKGKLQTKINYYDVFNSFAVRRVFREKSIIDNAFKHWFGQQRLGVSLSYSFGKLNQQTRQQHRSEEENRAGW